MTKAEFVKRLAQEAELAPAQASRTVEAFIRLVRESLKNGEDVQFAGFGKFSVSDRAARQGVNPRNPGTRIEIPARRVPKFTPGADLKKAVDTSGGSAAAAAAAPAVEEPAAAPAKKAAKKAAPRKKK
jgi:nucleoid DNA-binding protein